MKEWFCTNSSIKLDNIQRNGTKPTRTQSFAGKLLSGNLGVFVALR